MMVSTREQGSLMFGDGLLQASLASPAALDSHGQSGPVEASGSVLGAIEAVDGAPVGDAQVTLTATTALQHQTLSSDVNGNFAFTKFLLAPISLPSRRKAFCLTPQRGLP